MRNVLVKDLINDVVGKVFDEFESELEKQEQNIKGCFDVIKEEIKSTKENYCNSRLF